MNRRDLLATGAGLALSGFPFCLASSLQASGEKNRASDPEITRHAVLVRSGYTRKSKSADERAPSPSGMFDTEVVRSSDSDGRIAVFIFPPGDHHPYWGASIWPGRELLLLSWSDYGPVVFLRSERAFGDHPYRVISLLMGKSSAVTARSSGTAGNERASEGTVRNRTTQ